MKTKYYTLDKILELNCDYNIIYGERSNGKTTAVLGYGLKEYIESGYKNQLAIIRRWEEDFKGKNGATMFASIVALEWVKKWSNGRYNNIYYYSQRWYLCYTDLEGKKVYQDEQPFALAFSLTSEEHYKSTSYPNIVNVLFDEFITRSYYIPDEFVKFQNLLSTIIRLKTNVKIFMCGNTINQYCPYFSEMGLTNIKKQKKNSIDVYTYGEGTLKVAVEFSGFEGKSKASNKYFAFDNPKLEMIKNGSWEIAIYPHLPCKYHESEVAYKYYIVFYEDILECEIIYSKQLKQAFTFIHKKTTPIKEDNKNLVFSQEIRPEKWYRSNITHPTDKLSQKIWKYFVTNKVFYQDNPTGEIVRNFIMANKKGSTLL